MKMKLNLTIDIFFGNKKKYLHVKTKTNFIEVFIYTENHYFIIIPYFAL